MVPELMVLSREIVFGKFENRLFSTDVAIPRLNSLLLMLAQVEMINSLSGKSFVSDSEAKIHHKF